MEEYAGHMDDYDHISEEAKEQIVYLYQVHGATPDQIANLTGIPEHDVWAVLIEKKILPPNSVVYNSPNNGEVKVGNEVGSRKKIMGAKNVTKNKQLGTGATTFSYTNDNGRPKTHARFNKYQEKICQYWIWFMRLGTPFDCIGYRIGVDMDRPYEKYHTEIKNKIADIEADLHLDSVDASKVAYRKRFSLSIENGNFYKIGMTKFVPVYHYLEMGVINEWDVKEILHLNNKAYQKLLQDYLSKKEKNKKLYEGYINRWKNYLNDFNDGFKQYFDAYIGTDESVDDIVLEINSGKETKITREIFLLKVRLYAKRLNLTEDQKEEMEEVFLASHTITARDAYKEDVADEASSDSEESEETTTEETEEEAVKEEVSEKMEENKMKRKKCRVLSEEEIQDAWKRYSETEENVESIALALNVTPEYLYPKFKKIEENLPAEEVQEIRRKKKKWSGRRRKNISEEDFRYIDNEVRSGEINMVTAASILGISCTTYRAYRKKFATESSEPADTDNREITGAEVISLEVSTEEPSGRINSDPPYFVDENGIKRWNGNRFKYDPEDEGRPGIDPRVRSEVIKPEEDEGEKLEGAELLNEEGIIEEKTEEIITEEIDEDIEKKEEIAQEPDVTVAHLSRTVLIDRKPRRYLLGSDDKTKADIMTGTVNPMSYSSTVKQFTRWIQENIKFDEDGTAMEEIDIVAYNPSKQVELFAMNEACEQLGVTLEIIFSLELPKNLIPDLCSLEPENDTVVERIITSNPSGLDMGTVFIFPEDSRVEIEDGLQINDLYDKEFESVILRTYSNNCIDYSWRIISDGNGLDIYKEILVDHVTDLDKLLTVELHSSKIENGVIKDNDTKAIFSTYGANNGKEE